MYPQCGAGQRPSGHTGVAEEDLEFVEILPSEGHEQFLANARANLAAAAS